VVVHEFFGGLEVLLVVDDDADVFMCAQASLAQFVQVLQQGLKLGHDSIIFEPLLLAVKRVDGYLAVFVLFVLIFSLFEFQVSSVDSFECGFCEFIYDSAEFITES